MIALNPDIKHGQFSFRQNSKTASLIDESIGKKLKTETSTTEVEIQKPTSPKSYILQMIQNKVPRTDHFIVVKSDVRDMNQTFQSTDQSVFSNLNQTFSFGKTRHGSNTETYKTSSVFQSPENLKRSNLNNLSKISTNTISPLRSHHTNRNQSKLQTYREIKNVEVQNSLLQNYQTVKKSDIREINIQGYLERSRQSFDDWQVRFEEEAKKQKQIQEELKAQQILAAQGKVDPKKIQKPVGALQHQNILEMARSVTGTPPQSDRVLSAPSIEETIETITISIPKRPLNRLQKLTHNDAIVYFENDMEKIQRKKQENYELQEEFQYPFKGTKHLDLIGLNEDVVKMKLRTCNDFDRVNKLENDGNSKKSLTNYEAYVTQEKRTQTKGFFQNDSQRLKVVKHQGELSLKNQKDLITINPTIKAYLERQMKLDDRKLHEMKRIRNLMEETDHKTMRRNDRKFQRIHKKMMLETWQNLPTRGEVLQL